MGPVDWCDEVRYFEFLKTRTSHSANIVCSIDSIMAANMMPFFILMCELFNGVLRPQTEMPVFWAYTMYYITPFTYWIGGILSSILHGQPVICAASELVTFRAPPTKTCGEYAESFLASSTGYLTNPNDMGDCQYCPYLVGDEVSFSCLHIDLSPDDKTTLTGFGNSTLRRAISMHLRAGDI